ncbi:hypothetical protein EC957_002219 [Mortierella hygrophila]|uniref:Zn(2)-C6 fungal-type domain-containing protein n=1 Tax=Mortierella hygrophila TaxID=979708 RepID=A0A9P6F4M2_9FUNG|nr:hypothetical protein EC957_002219 [Mortierella hygrophila]
MFSAPMLLDFNSNSKRSKITKACDNCRRRRVKCDGTPDGCGGCKAAKTQCIYTTSNTKRGPPKGYVEVIEDRLGKIENMLAGIVKKKKNPSTPTNNNNDRATAGAGSDNDDNDNDDNDDMDNDNDNDNASIISTDLVEVKRQPPASPTLRGRSGSAATSVGPLGNGARHSPLVSRNRSLTSLLPFSQESKLQHHMEAHANYPGPVSQADMAALTDMFEKLGTTSVRTTVPFPWLTPEQSQHYGRNYLQFTVQSLEPPLPSLARSFSPSLSPDALFDLLNSFFDSFNTFLPILHRPTFMKQWDRQACQFCSPNHHQNLNKKHTQPQPQPQEAEAHKAHLQDPVAPLSPLLLNALLAIASKVPSSSSKTDSQGLETSQGYFDAARLLLDDFLDVPRVSTVQALCLMSQFHHQGQWKATRSSSYLSLAIRMAHELGLNRDPEVTRGPEADALRYLWWSMFILDHQFSAWLGLGLLMHGKESNVELPMDVQQDLRGFICLARLVKILGSVLQHSYSTQSLPPQFGGHDSMVSYIEGSLTSWLSNLSPEMRWLHPNNTGGRRGSPASPMRSPDTARLDRTNGDIYPAYLYIVYNTTLILLHRPYIVGAAGSPTAAQSNTICTGSGRAITDIAQGLEIARCSYVVNRFALYALLQAGVIHAMNAVYDKRGTEVAMEYYTRTINILEGFLSCAAYSGGVAEGIKILEQFLATTSKAAAEEEGANGAMDHGSTLQIDQAPTQPSRKKRQLDSVSSHSGSMSTQSTVQYQPSIYAVPMQTTAFAQQPILTPTLSMMTSPELMGGSGFAFDYNNQQQHSSVAVSDIKEQQKQQQLKIQQQHRLYQMQTFGSGAGAVKVEPTTDSLDLHKVEQQQQLQQQLLRQQLQRQQQQHQMEMSMKDQIGMSSGGSPHPSVLSSQSPNLAAPVIPSHRHALQMLQQQQQQQQQQHSFQHNQQHLRQQQQQQPVTMPLTMTMTSLSMEAQQKMSQDFQLSNMIATSTGYDPSQFWMDFSGGAGDRSNSAAGGNGLTSVGLEQEGLRIATTAAGEGQFGGNSSVWI